jgi:hypothetical protein
MQYRTLLTNTIFVVINLQCIVDFPIATSKINDDNLSNCLNDYRMISFAAFIIGSMHLFDEFLINPLFDDSFAFENVSIMTLLLDTGD